METKEINRQEYKLRIDKVTEYIHQNIDQPLSLHKMAGIACFSPFHFHRVFTFLTGETPTEYIKRTRIEKAALLLQNDRQLSATEIAVVVVSAVYHSSAATLNNISISLSVNFVHRNKHLKRHGKSDSNFSDLHHEETRHQAHRKSPGKVPANHPMECRFRGLGEGIKNRVQQYHRTRDFGNTPE